MQGDVGVALDIGQATAISPTVSKQGCLRFIPEKGYREWLWHRVLIDSCEPNEKFVAQPMGNNATNWCGWIWRDKRPIDMLGHSLTRWSCWIWMLLRQTQCTFLA